MASVRARARLCFNGAPRLGLGEGAMSRPSRVATASRLQWGSETGSRRRARRHPRRRRAGPRFNGAPRLGLGEGPSGGLDGQQHGQASMGLRDWVSEKAGGLILGVGDRERASMGLRDWVSEKGLSKAPPPECQSYVLQWGSETGSRRRPRRAQRLPKGARLQWGSETGSRRRADRQGEVRRRQGSASMGLRDWVSEKG